ncbi:Uncharacterised protein [Mycobacteroides abscessus subsp. abscessus]|nr:Uncharacterised protein [Mycobacteroides abscessus subsp. abscessus]
MFLGLPLRTTSATTEPNGMLLCGSAFFQSSSTSPALTRRVTSGSTEKLTTSAGTWRATLRDWSPDAPYDAEKPMSLPSGVPRKAGMILSNPGFGVA